MPNSILTLSIVGIVAGFVFSIPVAGPVSIVITSHSLKGEGRYCDRLAVGAAIVDFLYCFIAVFGFTNLYVRYERAVPWILLAGSAVTIYFGIQIMRTRLDPAHLNGDASVTRRMERIGQKGGFRTGLALNLLNPSLFVGWATSSLVVLSLVASLGFDVGDLNQVLSKQADTIKRQSSRNGREPAIDPRAGSLNRPVLTAGQSAATKTFPGSHVMNSLAYAFSVSVGTIVWFYFFSRFLVRHRHKLNVKTLDRIIHVLGAVLGALGLYLIYVASRSFMG
jgi:threonine/homoserine/homoserine lactone efflux protein